MNYRLVERSISLWKAKNGPFRDLARNKASSVPHPAFIPNAATEPASPLFIDYCSSECHYT